MVGGEDVVGDDNSAVLQVFPSERDTSVLLLLTDTCLTSHVYSSVLSGWVISACYILDISWGFANKWLVYAFKLWAFCFQQLFVPLPRCLKKVPREELGESGCRTLWLGAAEGEGV